MESNSVCNHMSDWQNQTTTWQSLICLITSMITHQIGRHKVLLLINHNFNKICEWYKAIFKIKTQEIPRFFFASNKKSHLSTHVMAHTVLLRLKSGQLITNQIWEFCYSMIMCNALEIIVFLQYLSKTGQITVETIERLAVFYK